MTRPKPHFTPAKRAGDFIFVSGQLPFTPEGRILGADIAAQTSLCITHIKQALEGVGADLSHVVKVMVWLTDPADFALFNQTYAEFFPTSPPARATVASGLMVSGAHIEMEAIAYQPDNG